MRREEEEECQPRLNTNTKRLNCKPSHSPVPRLVLHFTQSLLHKKHPPPPLHQPRVIINITEVDPASLQSERPRPGGSWGYCSEVRLLMIISDNPPPLSLTSIGRLQTRWAGAGRQLRRRRWGRLATGHLSLSPLAAITQINKLSESHINLTTSEAIEAMCHLSVLHTQWPTSLHPPRHLPLILTMMEVICKIRTRNKKLFSTEITISNKELICWTQCGKEI